MEKNISLVIPCYNEEGNIDKLIERCNKFLSINNSELILVNNGSTDKTKDKILNHSKINNKIKFLNIEKNIGFGHGVFIGLSSASNNFLAYTHADLQTDPNDIVAGMDLIKSDNDFIKGIRIDKIKNEWSYFDMFISYSMTIFTSLIFRKFMNDIHAQPVIFHKKLIKNSNYYPKDFMFDVWVYIKAKKLKFNVKRFPVIFNKNMRFYGEGNNDTLMKTVKGSFLHIFGTIKLFLKLF
ncbi:MAG: hypothetical protein CMI79_03180 [Candidatus Pelagibacter sp.]|nr:hypothetical protein [Candidatus Pelagibacter sp.]|tara:strand:+ start:433 stop:1146 length:714 start_codon:yes stop_codon:yes gene_type:complete